MSTIPGLSTVLSHLQCTKLDSGKLTLVKIPNSHSLGLKTVNSSVTEMEIAFAGSPE